MKSIRSLIAEEATVIRNGEPQTVPSVDIVVGDIVLLTLVSFILYFYLYTKPISKGNRVPADIRIVEASSDLRFDRSLLTGERLVINSYIILLLPSSSTSDMIPGSVISTSENAMETRNLALNSTFVVQGKCTGVVFATGDRTIMGRIVAMSGDTKFKLTTVQKEVWFFTKIISAVALGLFCIAMIVWAAWLRNTFPGFENASEAIINSIGCLTAFVPQVRAFYLPPMISSSCRFCRVYRYALRCPSLSLPGEWPLAMSSLRILQLLKH
jgi:sodium/potassium-transporting ATPase subunit alpha